MRVIDYTELQKPLPESVFQARRNGVAIAFRYNGKLEAARENLHLGMNIAYELAENERNGILGRERFETAVSNLARLGCAIELHDAYFSTKTFFLNESTLILEKNVFDALDACKKHGNMSVLRTMHERALHHSYRNYAGELLFEFTFGKGALRRMKEKYSISAEFIAAIGSELKKQWVENLEGPAAKCFRAPRGSLAYLGLVEKDLREYGRVLYTTGRRKFERL